MKEQNYSNPYLISFTAGRLLYDETISLQPYLNDEKIELIANEVKINKYLQTNSQASLVIPALPPQLYIVMC